MAVSKILATELTSARNSAYDLFLREPPIEDGYFRDRLGGDYRQLEVVKKDLHVRSCLERRAQAITARERVITAASTDDGDVHMATLARWVVDNLPWDEVEKKLWESAYINGRAHAEILWGTRDTPKALLMEVADPKTGRVLRPAYPYPTITVPMDIRPRHPEGFTFRLPSERRARQIRDATGLLGRNLRLPPQIIKGWELRYLTKASPVDGEVAEVFKFVHHSHGSATANPNGRGTGGDLYWPVTLKKEFIAFWVVYADKYAEPGKVGTFPAGEDGSLLAEFFATYGRNSWGVLPDGHKVELLEAQRVGNVNTYEGFMRWLDGQVSELITGQAYGVAVAQGFSGQPALNDETIRQEWVKADSDLLCPNMREYVLKPLTLLNIPTAEPPTYFRDFGDRENLDSRAERDSKLFAQGYRLKEESVARIYGDDYEYVGVPSEDDDSDGDEGDADFSGQQWGFAATPPAPPTTEPEPAPIAPATISKAAPGFLFAMQPPAAPAVAPTQPSHPFSLWESYEHWAGDGACCDASHAEDRYPEPHEDIEAETINAISAGFRVLWDEVKAQGLPSPARYPDDYQPALAEIAEGDRFKEAADELARALQTQLAATESLGWWQASKTYLPDNLLEGSDAALASTTAGDVLGEIQALSDLDTVEVEAGYDYAPELARLTLAGLITWLFIHEDELRQLPGESDADHTARVEARMQRAGWLPQPEGDAPATRAKFAGGVLTWSAFMAGTVAAMGTAAALRAYPYAKWVHVTPPPTHRRHHLALDGLILPRSDSFWALYQPPLGWNCRCYLEYLKRIPAGQSVSRPPTQTVTLKGVSVLAVDVGGVLTPITEDPSWLGAPNAQRNRDAALAALQDSLPDWLRNLIL